MTADDEMDQLFSVIGNMLTHSDISARHLWKKIIFHDEEILCFTSLWLVSNEKSEPAFIQMMLMPLDACKNNLAPGSYLPSPNYPMRCPPMNVMYGPAAAHTHIPSLPCKGALEMRFPVPLSTSVLQSYPVLHMFDGQSYNPENISTSVCVRTGAYLNSFSNGFTTSMLS